MNAEEAKVKLQRKLKFYSFRPLLFALGVPDEESKGCWESQKITFGDSKVLYTLVWIQSLQLPTDKYPELKKFVEENPHVLVDLEG